MTYIEIVEALGKGLNVYWKNAGYKVSYAHYSLYITFLYNSYYSKLQDSEHQDCFIGD